MRFRLSLEPTKRNQLLPLNYQYELSSAIYKVIARADKAFADFLHTQGYTLEKKHFKLFNFSNLYVPQYEIIQDRMKILSSEISLQISFYVDKIAENFIKGIFQNAQLNIGDRITQVDMQVKTIQATPVSLTNETIHLKTYSPIVISVGGDRPTPDYISPANDKFGSLLFTNLLNKYQAIFPEKSLKEMGFSEQSMNFNLLTPKPKERLVKMKAHTPQQTFVKGYSFDFSLTAPLPLLEIGLYSGFGEKNSQGFGFCGVK